MLLEQQQKALAQTNPEDLCFITPRHIHLLNAPWLSSPSPQLSQALRLAGSSFQTIQYGQNENPIKYDEYTIEIPNMPPGLTPEAYLAEMAKDLNNAVNNDLFDSVNVFVRRASPSQPVNFFTGAGGTSSTPPTPGVGTIYDIDIGGPDNGSVILVEQAPSHFVFQTILTPSSSTGAHPENGVREFGFERHSDGSVTFYTRGVSQASVTAAGYDVGARIQPVGWTALLDGISDELNRRGGNYMPDNVIASYNDLPTSVNPADILAEHCGYHRPTADAGPDRIVDEYSRVQLDGKLSSDEDEQDRDRLTYEWRQISGLVVNLRGSNTISPFFYAPQVVGNSAPHTLSFELIVSDGIFKSLEDTVTITVTNPPFDDDLVVNTDDDKIDSEGCNTDHCSLREAAEAANSRPGKNTIEFDLASDELTILTSGSLDLEEPVVIDGTTQFGYTDRPLVEISGSTPNDYGLGIFGGDSVVKGLIINGFTSGIFLTGNSSDTFTDTNGDIVLPFIPTGGNVIQGNYLGTDRNGAASKGNFFGIDISASNNNLIGGDVNDPKTRNIISGNHIGVRIINGIDKLVVSGGSTVTTHFCNVNCASSQNIVVGNYIGADNTGQNPLANQHSGVYIVDANNNYVGGNTEAERNIISGNNGDGISIAGISANSFKNKIQGNFIGTDFSGGVKLANKGNGIKVAPAREDTTISPFQNVVGGIAAEEGNTISGNEKNGIHIDREAKSNWIQGNRIGTNNEGRIALGNLQNGISVVGASTTLVGGAESGARNIISANGENGIVIGEGSKTSYVFGNYIGKDISNTTDLGNGKDGVAIVGSSGNTIGTTYPPESNIISANVGNGISVTEGTSSATTSISNSIRGNSIYENGKLGIDLGNNGITQNDDDDNDADSGPNDLMNYPVQGFVYYDSEEDLTIFTGTINTINPSSTAIDIYANAHTDSLGFGEGRKYVGQIPFFDSNQFYGALPGNVFNAENGLYRDYPHFTATTTDTKESTSEFSEEFVRITPPLADAGQQQVVRENANVILDGSNSTAGQGASISSYLWKQIESQPQVSLSSSSTYQTHFRAPEVSAEQGYATLFFRLKVTDSNGMADNDTMAVIVMDKNAYFDDDGDGIEDQIDIRPDMFSGNFSDIAISGSTNGTIIDRNSHTLLLLEEPNPDGVRIIDLPPAGLLQNGLNGDLSNTIRGEGAEIEACGGSIRTFVDHGDEFVLTCGSAILQSFKGIVDIELRANDGTRAATGVIAGNKIKFNPETSLLEADAKNTHITVVFVIRGNQAETIYLAPGESKFLSSNPGLFASAGPDKNVVEGTIGNVLDGSGSLGNNSTITSYSWRQISTTTAGGAGATNEPIVSIRNGNSAIARFDAPQITEDTPLTFELTIANNNTGATSSDRIVVTIRNSIETGQQQQEHLPYRFLAKWGTLGSGDGQLSSPSGVAFDASSGDVYVADTGNNRIQKFTRDGTFIAKWGTLGSGDGQLSSPQGLALDPQGNLYVADTGNNRIQKFTKDGTFIAKWGTTGIGDGQFASPRGVAVDSSGNIVYVADTGNNRIQKFTNSGSFIMAWGSRCDLLSIDQVNATAFYANDLQTSCVDPDGYEGGPSMPGDGQFSSPSAVSIDPLTSNVVVSDTGNHRLQSFSADGQLIQQIGTKLFIHQTVFFGKTIKLIAINANTYGNTVNQPFGLAFDGVGDLYSVSRANIGSLPYRILKFDDSQLQNTIGYVDPFNHPHGFNAPTGISVESTGNVFFVADTGNNRIQVFARIDNEPPSVQVTPTILINRNTPVDITLNATDPDIAGNANNNSTGLTFSIDQYPVNGTIANFNPKTHTLTYKPRTNFGGDDIFTFKVSDGIDSVIGEIRIHVNRPPISDAGPDKIVVEGAKGIALQGFNSQDKDIGYGDSIISTFWRQILADANTPRVNLTGNTTNTATFDAPQVNADTTLRFEITNTDTLGLSSTDAVTVTVRNIDNATEHYSFLTKWGSKGIFSGQFDSPADVAYDSKNDVVYVSDQFNDRIEMFDTAGTPIGGFGSFGTSFSGPGSFFEPKGIAFSPLEGTTNKVYVADSRNHRVQVFAPQGSDGKMWGSFGSGDGQFNRPSAVSVDPTTGNVYVGESGNPRVQKFTPTGQFILKFGSSGGGDGQFRFGISDIVVDSTGNVYVIDLFNRIQKFSSAGQFISKLNGITGTNIGIDSADNLYIVDKSSNIVRKVIPATGTVVSQIGSYSVRGAADGQFSSPQGVVTDPSGNVVFVADTGNNRIQAFSKYPNNPPVASDTQKAVTDINTYFDINLDAKDPDIGDRLTFSILKQPVNGTGFIYQDRGIVSYSPSYNFTGTDNFTYSVTDGFAKDNGTVIIEVGLRPVSNAGPDQTVNETTAVVLDGSASYNPPGHSIVSYEWEQQMAAGSQPSSAVELLQTDPSSPFAKFNSPRVNITSVLPLTFKLTVTDDRGLTSTDTVIVKVRNDNADQYSFLTKWGTAGPDIGQFNWPEGIAVDKSNGDVYVADTENNRVQKFNENGTFIKTWGFRNTASVDVPSGFNSVFDVAVDSARGYVYATDGGQSVQVFNRDGAFVGRFGQFSSVAGIEVDSSGDIYVADSSDNKVLKFSAFGGTFLKEIGSGTGWGDGLFSRIYDVAIDSKGYVYITDSQGGISPIQKFDSNGKFVAKWDSPGNSDSGDGEFGNERARGIAIDSRDHVYVVDTENNRVQKFDSSGNFITKFGLSAACSYDFENDRRVCPPYTSTDDGVFDFPARIAVEPTGDFAYTVDLNNNRIQKFARVNASPDNNFPVVTDKLVSTLRSTPVVITLNATDPDLDLRNNNNNNNNETLTFSISRNPAHGTLSQIIPTGNGLANVTYTPRTNYYGNDTFSYQVTDSRGAIDIAIVTIMVGDIPTPPVAFNQTITTTEDRTTEIILNGQDFNNDTLAFYVLPVNEGEIKQWTYKDGEIAGRSSYNDASGKRIYAPPQAAVIPSITRINDTAAKIIYTPPPNFNGTDSFQFFVRENTVFNYESEQAGNITINVVAKRPDLTFSNGDLFISSSEITNIHCIEIGSYFFCNDEVQFYHASVNLPPQVQWRSANGSQVDLLFTPEIVADFNHGSLSNRYGGTAFDPSQSNLYLTEKDPHINKVLRTNIFDNSGNYAGIFVDDRNYTYDNSISNTSVNATGKITQGPTSVVFDHAGNAYVAYRDGVSKPDSSDTSSNSNSNNVFHFIVNKFNSDGALVDTFELPDAISGVQRLGSRIHESIWIDLAPDQRTLYYSTATGENIKRFDTMRKAPLPDFASCLTGVYPSDIRILPDGGVIVIDGARLTSGGFLSGVHTSTIAEPSRILRIDKTGATTQIYDAPARDTWTSISLDPDGMSFWAADDRTSNIVKFDIASGNVLQSFDSGLERHSIAGLSVKGEPTAALTSTNGTFTINNTNTAALGGQCQSAPVVQDVTASTTNNTSVNITLTGTDANRYEYLTFSILNNTQNGTLGPITQINNTAANITYTPNAEVRNGTDSFTYEANDGILESSNTATVTILVNTANGTIITPPPPISNLPPIANAGPDQSVNENTTVTLNGTASYDPDGDGNGNDSIIGENSSSNITSYMWKQIIPSIGSGNNINNNITLSNATSATPVFTSPLVAGNNISSNLAFNLTVTDSDNATASDIVNITVKNVNQPPLADNQTVTTDEDTSIIINLTGNDPDLGDTLSFSVLQQPLFGNLTIDNNNNGISASNNSYNYTPNTNYYGSDSFVFSVRDNLTSDSPHQSNGTVNIEINPVNDAPVAINDTASTKEDDSVSIDVLGNDYDVDINDTISPYLSQAPLQGGNATINTNNNTITYSPPSDFFGIDTFAYLVKDSSNGSSAVPAYVMVNVSSLNDAPVAIDDKIATNEDSPVNIDIVANDTDIDIATGDTLSVTNIATQPVNGTAIINANNNTITYSPAANFDGEDEFEYTVSDESGDTDVAKVEVDVIAVNDLPVGVNDKIMTDKDTPARLNVLANDTDIDNLNNELSIGSISTQPLHGAVNIVNATNGTVMYTPNTGFSGDDLFGYKVFDGTGTSVNEATVSVTVNNVNNPPIANAGEDFVVDETTADVALNGTASLDPDLGDTISSLSWTQTNGPVVTLSDSSSATPTFTAPSVDQDTVLTFELTVTDNNGLKSAAADSVSVTVRNVNIPPTASAGPDLTVNENSINILLNGTASRDEDGIITTYLWNQVSGPAVTLNSTNTPAVLFDAPSVSADNSLVFNLTVTDNDGFASSDTITVVVKNVNLAPIANAGIDQTVNENTANVRLDGTASYDPDSEGGIASYSWTQTAGSTVTITGDNTVAPTFTAPSVTADTTLTFSLTVTDNEGLTSTTADTVNIIVKNINQPPDVSKATPSIATLWPPDHKMVKITIQNVVDPEKNNPVTIKITRIMQDEPVHGLGDGDISPDGGGINTNTAQLRSERAGTGDGRVYHIFFTATDSKGQSANGEVVVSVPYDQSGKKAIDSGSIYDSTLKTSPRDTTPPAVVATTP